MGSKIGLEFEQLWEPVVHAKTNIFRRAPPLAKPAESLKAISTSQSGEPTIIQQRRQLVKIHFFISNFKKKKNFSGVENSSAKHLYSPLQLQLQLYVTVFEQVTWTEAPDMPM